MSAVDTYQEAVEKAKRIAKEGKCLSQYLFAVSGDLVWLPRTEYESLEQSEKG